MKKSYPIIFLFLLASLLSRADNVFIGTPSLISQIISNVYDEGRMKMSGKIGHSHNDFYTERWANTLAAEYFSTYYGVDWNKSFHISGGRKYYYKDYFPTY